MTNTRDQSGLDFQLWQPEGAFSSYVQGIWSAFVADDYAVGVQRWLRGDACSGVVFNLGQDFQLDDVSHSTPVIRLPTSQQAHNIFLPPGAQLAGIRFQPGVYATVFENQPKQALANLNHGLLTLANALRHTSDLDLHRHQNRINTLQAWLASNIDFSQRVPTNLLEALLTVQQRQPSDSSSEHSQNPRQMERLFQRWLGISPKRYQRLLRVKSSVDHLKENPDASLVELALQQGFSDQAHMTREFNQIAKITPKRYSKLCKSTKNTAHH